MKRQQLEDNRISYIKNPMAANSIMCLIYTSIGLLLFVVGIAIGVRTQGNIPLGGVAVCFSSFLFSGFGVKYGFASFKESQRNYSLARIGITVGGFLVILWLVMILIGIRRLMG